MTYLDFNPALFSRLNEILDPHEAKIILDAHEERRKYFSQMIRLNAHSALQEQ